MITNCFEAQLAWGPTLQALSTYVERDLPLFSQVYAALGHTEFRWVTTFAKCYSMAIDLGGGIRTYSWWDGNPRRRSTVHLDAWLVYMPKDKIILPTSDDLLDFAEDVRSASWMLSCLLPCGSLL